MNNKVGIVTTVKANKRVMIEFVNYHLNIGIDHIFLFFDNPNDLNIKIFSTNAQVTAIACTQEHWRKVGCSFDSDIEIRQKANANYAIEMAIEKKLCWITHIDIDELIYSKYSFKTIIEKSPENTPYIWLKPYEAIPSSMICQSPFQQITQFKVLSKTNLEKLMQENNRDLLSNILYSGQYFRGHIGGKSIVNISTKNARAKIQCLGIHKPTFINNKNLKVFTDKELHLLHYDCYDFNNWITKWTRRYDGTATFNGRMNRKKQYHKFEKSYQTGSNKALLTLYQRFYHLSHTEKELLMQYSLIKEITIPKSLFTNRHFRLKTK